MRIASLKAKSAWLFEFSKKVVQIIVSLYVIHIVYSDLTMLLENDLSPLGEITHDFTQVVIVCLGGYLFKATLENVFKIKDHYDPGRAGSYEDYMG